MAGSDSDSSLLGSTSVPEQFCCTPCCKIVWIGCACCMCITLIPLLTAYSCITAVVSDTMVLVEGKDSPIYTVDEYPGESPIPTWVNYRAKLENSTEGDYAKLGWATWDDAPFIMYNATKIAGNWELVPEKLRGIYWMNGNGMPEVLASLQYSKWFEDEKILLLPVAPYNWGWYGGPAGTAPSGAFGNGNAYKALGGWWQANNFGTAANVTTSFAFGPCPAGYKCREGSNNFSFASLQSHPGDDLSEVSLLTRANTWTMEEMDGPEPGSLYYRGNYWFCGKYSYGSYDLMKIVTADGKKLEPHWSQYKAFKEGHPEILQSGWNGGP
eukprot:TRINITY_DN9034_c0_g1_i1.p1 TRINITY_DN9034_c0_g1~~TRINITY_DN9034_c0_g1_i1.p1  ORF type:complete len:346 (+),score=48.02 TRINITY_DN9034_c0_g1_i1:62-1039(+)